MDADFGVDADGGASASRSEGSTDSSDHIRSECQVLHGLLLLSCWAQDPSATRRGDAEVPDAAGDPVDSAAPRDSAAPSDSADELAPQVTIHAPGDGARLENPVRFDLSVVDVEHAVLDADGYELARVEPGRSELEYTFSGTGYPRVVTLTGYDATGAVAALGRVTIEIDPGEVSLDVPYFYQYDNDYEPSGTCGVTSAAMLVDTFHPGSVTPDSLYLAYGKAQGQSPDGLAELYREEGLKAAYSYSGTRAEVRAHLDAGRPVVAHGYWTGSGHVAVIVGYSDTEWIVNDPAGDWYTCYGCGEADHVRYPIGGAWDDEMSVDGDVWYSTADTSAF